MYFILILFYILLGCYITIAIPENVVHTGWILLGILAIIYIFSLVPLKKYCKIIFFYMLYTMFGLVSTLYNGNLDITELFWPIAYASIGTFLLILPPVRYSILVAVNFIFIIYVLLCVAFLEGTFIRSINGVNVVLLLIVSIFAINNMNTSTKTELLFCCLALFATLLTLGEHSGGRSGCAVFLYLVCANIIMLIKRHFKFMKLIGIVLLLVPCIFLISSHTLTIDKHIANFSNRGIRSTRYQIWKDYASITINNGVCNILLGAPFAYKTEILSKYSNNLHNSFLMLHAKYGVVMLFIVILLILYSLSNFYINHEFKLLTYCLAWIFRMLFDYTNFNAMLDILFVIYVFYNVRRKNILTNPLHK